MFLKAQGATFPWYQFINYGGGGGHMPSKLIGFGL